AHVSSVGPAEDRHEITRLRPLVAEAAHHPRRDGDGVPLLEHDLLLTGVAPVHAPAAGQRHEHLHGRMGVDRAALAGLGADQSQTEVAGVGDRGVERRVLGNPSPDDVEDLALVAGDQAVDERLAARLQRVEASHAPHHLVHADLDRIHLILLRRWAPLYSGASGPEPLGIPRKLWYPMLA